MSPIFNLSLVFTYSFLILWQWNNCWGYKGPVREGVGQCFPCLPAVWGVHNGTSCSDFFSNIHSKIPQKIMLKQFKIKQIFIFQSEEVQIYTISKTESPISMKEKSVLHCDLCEFKTNWKVNLTRHRNSIHFSTVYKCESCDYVATRLTTLNTHKKTAHEGCVYFCDQCSFSATWKQTLKRHKASKHEMKRFPCDYCDFTATRREHLKNHEKSSHLGQIFSCSLCPFKVWRKK